MADAFHADFMAISAVFSGVKEIREAVARAEISLAQKGRASILFVDEVHRFNKAQQDAFLPYVEGGLLTFVGATTTLEVVWNFSDTMNGLMIIPNLICLLWLNKDIAEECFDYEEHVVAFEKKGEQIDYQGESEAAEDELAGQKS